MALAKDELSKNAMGGSELIKYALERKMPAELMDNFQIYVSRVQEPLDPTKIRLLWLQDLPNDPASQHLANGGWNKFHKIVFNSNWQMQAYINQFNIPWSKCVVMLNCIEPFNLDEVFNKPTDHIKLAYWSTPHRGLNILVPVFEKLAEKYPNIQLDVFSSFKIYGWAERDKAFEDLFQACKDHPRINYFGSVPNDQVRESLKTTHIMAYPNIWPETSCMALMEGMAAGLLCVHSNLACLYETAANWTNMYQYQDDVQTHAQLFYNVLDNAIENIFEPAIHSRLVSQSSYANLFYNWDVRKFQWEALLTSLLNEPREIPENIGQAFFEYRT